MSTWVLAMSASGNCLLHVQQILVLTSRARSPRRPRPRKKLPAEIEDEDDSEDDDVLLRSHQLRSWKPGSYAAWISLHAPNQLDPLHLEGTAEIPSVLCPRKVRSFAACTCVKSVGTARYRRRALDLRCRRVEFLPGSSSANPARTLVAS